MAKFNLEANVRRLLTPQEVLSSFIFNKNDVMRADVRDGLLKIADYIIRNTISDVEGLEVQDICLTGSMSGYLYRPKSDIDMRIVVKNKNNKALAKDKKLFDKFLSTQWRGLLAQGYGFRWQKRLVDVKISSSNIDFLSLYSIKDNKWLIKPQKDLKISEDEMIAYYQKRRQQIMDGYHKIKKKYRSVELSEKMGDLYTKTVLRSIDGHPSIKDYFVFKLLSDEGVLRKIGTESILAYNSALSITPEH